MTDRECLEQLIEKLNLQRIEETEGEPPPNLYRNLYCIGKYGDYIQIHIGPGIGDVGLQDIFVFNNNGDIISHSIWRE